MTTNEFEPASPPAEPPQETKDDEVNQESIWLRLVFMIVYAAIAWFVFGFTVLLAVLQFIVTALNKSSNDDLKSICRSTIMYLSDLLAYVAFLKDEKPFPLGQFPKKNG